MGYDTKAWVDTINPTSETEVLIKAASEDKGTGSSEPIIPERLPFPVARLQSQPLPKGTTQTSSNPKPKPKPPRFLWRDDADDDEDDETAEVKPMEVQRMVITTPTPDWLVPQPQPYPADGASTSASTAATVQAAPSPAEATPATATPETTAAAPTVTTNETAPVIAEASQAGEASQAPPAPPTQEAQDTQETTPTQPTPTATIPPPTPTLTPTPTLLTQASASTDVSTLLGPDISISFSRDSTKQRSSLISNDSSSTLAPPTPGSGKHSRSWSDVSQEEDESDDGVATDYADTDDEADVPFPLFLVRDGLPDSILGTTIADEDDLAWADVPPPAALSEMVALPDGAEIPELLREVLSSCIESVQAQLAVAVSEKAERDKVRAAEAETAAAARAEEKRKRREELERKRKEEASSAKGKGKDTETRHIPDPVDLRVSLPLPNAAAPVKKSRRQMFASRVMRHVHVLSGSSDKAESSAAGAAAAAEAAQAAAARAALQKALEQEKLRAHDLTYNKAWERQTLSVATGEGNSSSSQQAIPRKPVKSLAAKLTKGSTTEQWPFTNKPATTTDATPTQPRETRAFQMLAKVNRETRAKNGTLLPATIECISCFEDIPRKEAVQTVCHAYCIECFQQLVTTALANEAQFPPKCCLNEVPAATVTKYVSRDVAKQYKDKIDEFAIPVSDRVYCPTVDCGVFVPPAHIAKAARIARCRNGHETCTACRQAAHGRGSANREACPEASAQDQRDQRMADELAAEEGWRRCIRCAILIEHREACQHMTCRCGAEFCYVCGLAWRTCRCDMDDLNRIKREADARRAQRSAREALERERIRRQAEQADAELAELRDALAQVAAFEERERRKMRKIQLAQRERLQKLHAQREAELKAEAAVKYDALRATLATLRDLQAKAAQEARRKERAEHRLQQARDAAEADVRLVQRRAETAEAAAAKIREAEQHWTKDYVVRLAMETRLENEYRQELEAFGEWKGREDQPELVEKGLRAYQRVNDAALDTYTQWKDRTLAETKFMADEEKAVRDEVQDALRAKHTLAARKDRRALHRKHAGERVWCRAVAAEQARLLDEMQYWEDTLGLAGSSNDTDLSLLSLLSQMNKLTGEGEEGGEGGDNDNERSEDEKHQDDSDMSQLYSVLVAELAGDDDAEFLDLDDSDDENDVYYDVHSGGGSSSNAIHANANNNGAGSSRGNEYSWPFAANEAAKNSW